MTGNNDDEFNRPWLLICEGVKDKRVFEGLFQLHGFSESFLIKPTPQGGREAFGSYLDSIASNESYLQNVKAILIVSDNDSDAAASFAAVQKQIEMVSELPIPATERTVARKGNAPAVVVLMVPIGGLGNLETMCLEAAHNKWGLREELEAYVQATPAINWSAGKQSKMRLQIMLASHNERQPDAGFAASWAQKEDYRISLEDACFKPLVDFLRGFGDMLK